MTPLHTISEAIAVARTIQVWQSWSDIRANSDVVEQLGRYAVADIESANGIRVITDRCVPEGVVLFCSGVAVTGYWTDAGGAVFFESLDGATI